ncbi:Cytochrome P450 [Dillenia turbinata]|uniref:Cytochrome P450 n=1 Tax=Dillenia turbinata TaxID=194707 RepID=A0AAN8UR85_9MAGN
MDFLSLALCLLLVWTVIQALLSATKPRKLPLPPGPFPFPVIGNLLKLGDKPHKSITKLSKTYGPIMSLKLGQVTTVVISSPTIAKEVLQTNDISFSYRSYPDSVRAHDHHENSMGWLPPSNKWRSLRKISNSHIFAAKTLDGNQHLRREKIEDLLKYVNECSETGVAVNIGRAAFVTLLNLISNTMFSVDLVNPKSDEAQEFKELVWNIMMEIGTPNLADYFPVLKSIDPQGIRGRLTAYFEKVFDIFDHYAEQRLQSSSSCPTTGTDFLDIVLGLIQENKDIDKPMIMHLFLLEEGVDSREMDMDDKFGITLQKAKPLVAVPIKL